MRPEGTKGVLSLELLVPTDIERHLILNKNRLGTYEEMKQEIEVLIETVAGAKGKVHRPGSSGASGSGQGPAPMDVDAFTKVLNSLVKGSKGQKGGKGKGKDKGGGKGKGKGNEGKRQRQWFRQLRIRRSMLQLW